MIRRAAPDGSYLLVAQHDHALLAGRLAERVGNARFARPDPFERVVTGVMLHDAGWPLHDDEPTLNPRGEPLDVFEVSRTIGLRVWQASADEAEAADPYAGLLTSLHVLALSVYATSQTSFDHEKFDTSDAQERFAVNKFQHREVERQEALRRRLGLRTDVPLQHGLVPPGGDADADDERLRFNFRLLQAMDLISLAVCCTAPPAGRTQDVHPRPGADATSLSLARDGDDVLVDPWPFDVPAVEVEVPYRRVPGGTYTDEVTFRATYAAAPVESLAAHVRQRG
jgi:hypothetical protein